MSLRIIIFGINLRIRAFFITTLLVQFYILNQYVDNTFMIISFHDVWVPKISLTSSLFIEVSVPACVRLKWYRFVSDILRFSDRIFGIWGGGGGFAL